MTMWICGPQSFSWWNLTFAIAALPRAEKLKEVDDRWTKGLVNCVQKYLGGQRSSSSSKVPLCDHEIAKCCECLQMSWTRDSHVVR